MIKLFKKWYTYYLIKQDMKFIRKMFEYELRHMK